ncbi:MAG: tetratricopeptide repeat protein [Phycisphaerales bacterium]|nr:MAG: tetratricopeptide repeat protein [Phycisphaerales bacterium]
MTAIASQLVQASGKHQSGELAKAETIYRKILAREPKHGDALNLLGVLCGQTGRWDESLKLLRRAVGVRPEHPQSRYNLGNVLRQLGRNAEALAQYEAAVNAAAEYAPAHFNRGLTLWDLQRPEEALDAFNRVLEIDSHHAEARAALAEVLLNRGDVEGAARQWRWLVEADPSKAAHRIDLGIALHRMGRLDDAIEQFRSATELQPRLAATWCNLGASLRIAGRSSEAIDALEKAIELDPALVAAHTNIAAANMALKQLPRAIKACRAALQLAPRDASVHSTAARALVEGGELAMAEEHLRIALGLEPQSPALHTEMGDLLRKLGRFEEAEAAYAQALRLDSSAVDATAGRVESLLQRGDSQAALDLAESALRKAPYDVIVGSAAASANIACGRYGEAADLLQRQVDHERTSPAQKRILLFRLGDVYDRTGDYPAAWETYDQANRLKEAPFNRMGFAEQVDAIRRVFSRPALDEGPRADPGPVRPVFIAGMPRSGTTLIEQILDSHPDLTGGGELGLMGRIIGRCEPLTGVAAPWPQCASQFDRDHLQKLADFANEILVDAAGSGSHVTEKTPANSLYLGLIEMLFPEARIIWCLRDPLDTCLSCYFHDFTGALPFTYDLNNLGFVYRRQEELLQHWTEALNLPLMTVQYEEMVDDQEGMTRRLLEFCGLPWDDGCLQFHRNRRVAQTASTLQVREPIYRSSVNRHRHYEQYLQPLREALADQVPEGTDPD